MTQIPKNPFDREDWFSELVKSNDSIMNSSKQAFLQFQTKYNPQSMTTFQKVLTFFATHTITAVVTASICLGGIATFAAQTVAPEQYKPSTVINNLFKNNKIQQTNPNTPLVSDAQNDVVSYDPCNISIKYPKQIAGEKIVATLPQDYNQPGDKTIPDYYGVTVTSQKSFNYDSSTKLQGNVAVSCSKNLLPILDNNLNSKMTTQELAELTGWFITGEQKLEDIKTESQGTAGPYRTIYFKFNNIYYTISFITTKIPDNILNLQPQDIKTFWNNTIAQPGIFGDQIQIQFNDVAKNIPNAEILKFDNVPTNGFKFEYDKKLILQSRVSLDNSGSDQFVFVEDKIDNNFTNDIYYVTDKNLVAEISKLGISNGNSVIFTGQVINKNSTINKSTREEFTITKIDKLEKSINSKLINNNSIKIIKDIDIRLAGIGLYTAYEDINSGEQYIIKDENSEVSNIIGNVVQANPPKQEPGIRKSGNDNIFTLAGEVLDLGNNQYEIIKVNTFILSPNKAKDGNKVVRTDGPSTSEKNGLQVFGDLFVPKSQSVRATESFDEYSPLECDIVPLKMYANNSNGQLFVTNEKAYTANGIGSSNSTPQRLNQLKEYISTGKGEIINSINAFHSGCGGYAAQTIKELGYTNKNGRQARAVIIATGQEAIAGANV
jgi:hypothetical protein